MTEFKVTIVNTAPEGGVRFTPTWVGFHDGSFDTYNTGVPQTPELNAIAEDGNTAPISELFLNRSGLTSPVDGTIFGPTNGVFFPGGFASGTFDLNTTNGYNSYFSYATMVIPSNDAFISNADPLAHRIIDEDGNPITVGFTVLGSQVRDGGTEDNDEFPANTAGLAQTVPNTGTTSNNVIVAHPGFIEGGNILAEIPNGDFTQEGYQIAQVSVTAREDANPEDNLVPVTVTVENIAPEEGVRLSPFWVGFHNGTFDSYDGGSPSSPELEALAEDADTQPISDLFNNGSGLVSPLDGTLRTDEGGPIFPGTTVTLDFELNTNNQYNNYFSYVSMIVPSNDAFVANGNPQAHNLFDENGDFVGANFIIGGGSEVNDAGTEQNDEFPAHTLGLAQTEPDSGQPSSPMNPEFPGQTVITVLPGFIPGGNILAEIPNGDFTQPDYEVAQIFVTAIQEEVELVASLTPDQEVPDATASEASGSAELTLSEDGTSLHYSIHVSGVDFGAFTEAGTPLTEDTGDDVTALHFHNAPRGENGPVVFGLIGLAQDEDDLEIQVNEDGSTYITGYWELTDNANAPLTDFVDEIRGAESGEDVELYLNLHTVEFPAGEIRGQLQVELEEVEVVVTIENLAPENGTNLSPFWVGFHEGDFDSYDGGQPTSPELERLVEDRNNDPLSGLFNSEGIGRVDASIGDVVIAPGDTVSETFTLEPSLVTYFSYASMILPSNDAYVANGNPVAHPIFDESGEFIGAEFVIFGSAVNDAGTEINDEIAENTPLLGQTVPDTGVPENGVNTAHPGFIEGGPILTAFPNADFTQEGYEIARVTITLAEEEPEGPTLIFGSPGNDTFDAGVTPGFDGVNDLLFTGAGEDLVDLSTSTSNSRVYGGGDDDELFAGSDDRLFGGEGDDILDASVGEGGNRLYGTAGDDELYAGGGDRLFGGVGDDILDASVGEGDNRLYGGDGDDLFSLGSNDRLVGGEGNDTFNVVTGGENLITGGPGDDIFNVVNAELPETYNTITDFEAVDRIGINGLGIGFSDLELSPNDGNAAIGVPVGDGTFARVAVLLGVDSANLVENYFDFG